MDVWIRWLWFVACVCNLFIIYQIMKSPENLALNLEYFPTKLNIQNRNTFSRIIKNITFKNSASHLCEEENCMYQSLLGSDLNITFL